MFAKGYGHYRARTALHIHYSASISKNHDMFQVKTGWSLFISSMEWSPCDGRKQSPLLHEKSTVSRISPWSLKERFNFPKKKTGYGLPYLLLLQSAVIESTWNTFQTTGVRFSKYCTSVNFLVSFGYPVFPGLQFRVCFSGGRFPSAPALQSSGRLGSGQTPWSGCILCCTQIHTKEPGLGRHGCGWSSLSMV